MIKVYIYVTGLVLYQFSGNGSLPTRALLAAGGYAHPGLGHICRHEVNVEVGPESEIFRGLPPIVRFTVPPGTPSFVPAPPEVPDLSTLVENPRVRDKCAHQPEFCTLPGSAQPSTNGLLEFVGSWRTLGLTDCGTRYPDSFIEDIEFDFVRATRSWELRTRPPQIAKPLANSVLFFATVPSAAGFTVSDPGLASVLAVAPPHQCRELPEFSESDTGCIVMIVRNGPTDQYQGGGDLHFASLYTFLQDPPSADEVWLPIKVDGEACPGGGGTGGLSRCVGGRIVQ